MIKIKLAILETDHNYISRIVNVFNSKFNEKLEVYSFTSETAMHSYMQANKVDVILASEEFSIDVTSLDKCIFAYLTESSSIDSINGQRTICKFQKAEQIYKEILALYSESSADRYGFKYVDDDSTKILSFYSCSGGVGSSTLAAACCYSLAAQGKKVLYFNLELLGSPQIFFSGEGAFTLSDIIFAIKSKKSNLAMKLESSVKQDPSGVYFYDACATVLDLFELTTDEMVRLLNELKNCGMYDYIIVDNDLVFDSRAISIMVKSNRLLFVSDGTPATNHKFRRIYDTLQIVEGQYGSSIISKVTAIYNKFSDQSSKQADIPSVVQVLGSLPEFSKITTKDLALHIAGTPVFNSL